METMERTGAMYEFLCQNFGPDYTNEIVELAISKATATAKELRKPPMEILAVVAREAKDIEKLFLIAAIERLSAR